MHASLIQEFPKLEHRESSTSSSRRRSQTDSKESFKERFDSELNQSTGPRPSLNSDQGGEAYASDWLSESPFGASPSPSAPSEAGTREMHSEEHLRSSGKQPGGNHGPDAVSPDAKTSHPSPGNQKDAASSDTAAEKADTGKNVTSTQQDSQGTAKNAPRPTAPSEGPLTYGAVKPAGTMLASAGSAASTTVQTMQLHPGTPHASTGNQAGSDAIHHGAEAQTTQTVHTMKREATAQIESTSTDLKAALGTGGHRVGHADASSFGSSFQGGGSGESGSFAQREGAAMQALTDIKTPTMPASQTTVTVESIRKMQAMIQEQVVVLKQLPNQSMQVMIRPDANLSLFLTLQQTESDVAVAARMDQATGNLLKPHWETLQKELEAAGIRLGHPETSADQGDFSQDGNPSRFQDKETEQQQALLRQNKSTRARETDSLGNVSGIDPHLREEHGSLVSWA